jgi:hypothetical protein
LSDLFCVALGDALGGSADRLEIAMVKVTNFGTVLKEDAVPLPVEAVRQNDLALGSYGHTSYLSGCTDLVIDLQKNLAAVR